MAQLLDPNTFRSRRVTQFPSDDGLGATPPALKAAGMAAANGYGDANPNTSFDPTNPWRLKRSPVASGDGGGIPATPPAVTPAGTAAGQTARALGTQAGQLVRGVGREAVNQGIGDVNTFNAGAVGNLNKLTYPVRAAAGFVRDFDNALSGNPASSNAGNPTNGLGAPTLAPVDWSKAGAASDNGGGIPATPPSIPKPAPIFGATADQMRAAGAVPAVPSYETGVTLSDGRKLPIGAMVNGVPTFSDGSNGMPGKPGTIPRTMTDAEIKGLGAQLPTVPAGTAPAGFASPVAFNSDNSDANIANILRSREGGKFGITPEMNAQADLASIINQDPRSTLGRAAMNASRSANAAGTTLERKAALDTLSGLETGAVKNYLDTTQGQNTLANTEAAGQNALDRANVGGLFDIAGQRLRNEGQLANTELAGKYGIAEALARPQARAMLDPNKINSDALALIHNSPQLLGLDSMGNVIDATTGKARAPTAAESAALLARARAILLGQSAAAPASTTTTAKPTFEQVRAAALQQNPNLTDTQIRTYHSAKYGS